MMGGGIVLPRSTYGAAGDVLQYLPSAALGDVLRDALIDQTANAGAFVVLTIWAVLAAVVASRTFKWELAASGNDLPQRPAGRRTAVVWGKGGAKRVDPGE